MLSLVFFDWLKVYFVANFNIRIAFLGNFFQVVGDSTTIFIAGKSCVLLLETVYLYNVKNGVITLQSGGNLRLAKYLMGVALLF